MFDQGQGHYMICKVSPFIAFDLLRTVAHL